jgi:hypothetical protein
VKTQIRIMKINDEEYMMQWENQDASEIFEGIKDVTLTCPHERLRSLKIDENGMLSTSYSSSFFYYII